MVGPGLLTALEWTGLDWIGPARAAWIGLGLVGLGQSALDLVSVAWAPQDWTTGPKGSCRKSPASKGSCGRPWGQKGVVVNGAKKE